MWSIGGMDASGSAVTTNRFLDEGLPCACGPAFSDISWLEAEPITGTVPAGSAASVQITFTAQPTMTLGATLTATLRLRTNDPLLGEAAIPVTMTVGTAAQAGVELEPEVSNRFGDPGSLVTHTLVLTNSGSVTETYLLAYGNATVAWEISLAENTLTLSPGQRARVQVQVSVPQGAVPGDEDRVTLIATAQSNPDVSDAVELATRVAAHRFYFPSMWGSDIPGLPGFPGSNPYP
jgi:hypothetical protein